jgi:hypothetical protein
VCAAVTAVLPAAARAETPRTHTDTLTASRVASAEANELVVTLDGSGDLRGFITLKLDVDADGIVTGGDWALVSRYAEYLNADGSVDDDSEPIDETKPHQEFVRMVDNGTVGGHVTAGTVTAGANGQPMLVGLQLELTSGSLTFDGVRGTGSLDADFSQTGAQGSLRLDF